MHPTPSQLVDSSGKVALGRFKDTVGNINGREAAYRTPMGAMAGRLQRHFHYKQFQYFGIISDELLVGCALADTAWLGLAFAYVYDVRTGELTEFTWRSPLASQLAMSPSPTAGCSRFQQGQVLIELGYEQQGDARRKTLSLSSPGLEIHAALNESAAFEPMSLCTRIGINGWAYANKVAAVPVSGSVTCGQRSWNLESLNASAHHDFSAGYMRRETFWNWACTSALVDGQRIGWNLSCGVNETSMTENCLWLDGHLIKVDHVRFDYDGDNLMNRWSMRSEDGIVELDFEPAGRHQERLDLKLFASNFNQIFGHFNGRLNIPGQTPIEIKRVNGFVEEQYSKW